MVLHKAAKSRHRKCGSRVAKRLAELRRLRSQKILKGIKKINSAKTIRRRRAQTDTLYINARFPDIFPVRARVGVARLVMIFAAVTQSRIRPSEIHHSGDVDLWSIRLRRAQDRVTRCDLKAQIAYGIGAIDGCKRAGKRIVGDEAAAARAHIG